MDKTGPKHKTCRRVGAPLCGRPNCPSNKRPYPPGQHGRGRKRISEYQTRLLEKQKLRHMYGVNEKQMRGYFEKATRSKSVTGEEMIRMLETRLDTVCLRLGFAQTTSQARQLVSHGHVSLDGRRIDIPSAQVKPGQTITLSPKARNFVFVREALEITRRAALVPLPEQGRGLGNAQPLPGARRDPAPGPGRRAPDRRVLRLSARPNILVRRRPASRPRYGLPGAPSGIHPAPGQATSPSPAAAWPRTTRGPARRASHHLSRRAPWPPPPISKPRSQCPTAFGYLGLKPTQAPRRRGPARPPRLRAA